LGKKKGNPRGKIDRIFINYYSDNNYENLDLLVKGLTRNKLLLPRMKIITDCLMVLKQNNKQYNSSNVIIPALIAQIDGILTDYARIMGISSKGEKRKNELRKILTNKRLSKVASDYANEIILDLLFQKAFTGKALRIPFTFNRHKVMHGEFLKYGRIDHTLRAFLIIEFLSYCSK